MKWNPGMRWGCGGKFPGLRCAASGLLSVVHSGIFSSIFFLPYPAHGYACIGRLRQTLFSSLAYKLLLTGGYRFVRRRRIFHTETEEFPRFPAFPVYRDSLAGRM